VLSGRERDVGLGDVAELGNLAVQGGIKQPVDDHTDPVAGGGERVQVVAAGHGLGGQAGQPDAEWSGDGVPAAQVDREPEVVVLVRAGPADAEGGRQVAGGGLGLSLRVLGGGRGDLPRSGAIWHRGGVPQRPHATVAGDGQARVDDEPAFGHLEPVPPGQNADERAGGNPGGPHHGAGRDVGSVRENDHGKRLSPEALRAGLTRAATQAGLDHITPHQLRHTSATALVNAGVSLQSLMVLLGHVSAEMSLRYGRLFDQTVRTEYERALTLAKQRLGPVLPPASPIALTTDWRQAPAIKARLAGGFCVRAEAQGPCPYANICEHCPNFRTDATYLPVLAAQRVDAETLAADTQARGWVAEAERHQRLIARIDLLMRQAPTA
jgi:Phage integrase family